MAIPETLPREPASRHNKYMGTNISAASDVRAVLDGVRRIVQNLRESSRSAEKNFGMSGAQLFVLQKLAESPAQSLNELAARTHTHQSSVSTIVARLVATGLVTRAHSPADGRTVQLDLTARGRRLVDRAPHAAQDRLIHGIRRLPAARRRALASALSALGHAMDADRDPVMFFEDGRRRPRIRRSARA
jgi:MarR family transcriptional regulator, lower aerobic nicotinate degradation pathway regulator